MKPRIAIPFTSSGPGSASLRVGVYGSVTEGEFEGSLVGDVLLEFSKTDNAELSHGAIVTVAEWRGRPAASALQK